MKEEMCEHAASIMLASELVAELQDLIIKHGDLPVFIYSSGTEPCAGAWHMDEEQKKVKAFTNSKTYPEMILIS
jgi:hypothetical protein